MVKGLYERRLLPSNASTNTGTMPGTKDVINASMFLFELSLGFAARSVALQADAVDSPGDAANYGISLSVVNLALHHRARAAMVKGISMVRFGLWIVGSSLRHLAHGKVPEASTMTLVGTAALLANALTFALLRAYRSGLAAIMGALAVQGSWVVTRRASQELAGAGA